MGAKLDLTGQVFHRLTVISEAGRSKDKKVIWNCECLCGNSVAVVSSFLRSGDTKSCGCLRKEKLSEMVNEKVKTHGLSKHPLFKVWDSMKERCYNPNHKSHKDYGERGITVCDKWRYSFEEFYNDAILGYAKGLQLDRVKNDEGYAPENIRWVTAQQNNMNRRGSKNGSSKYKGVGWDNTRNSWRAWIKKDYKLKGLGYYGSEDDAALAYNEAAKELFGEYAYLNKIETN